MFYILSCINLENNNIKNTINKNYDEILKVFKKIIINFIEENFEYDSLLEENDFYELKKLFYKIFLGSEKKRKIKKTYNNGCFLLNHDTIEKMTLSVFCDYVNFMIDNYLFKFDEESLNCISEEKFISNKKIIVEIQYYTENCIDSDFENL